MKRQADGLSCLPKEGTEQSATNGNKRIKLLENEDEEISQVTKEEGSTLNMNDTSCNHKDQPSISKNDLLSEYIDGTVEKDNTENHSSQNLNENGNFNHTENNNNGSCNEAVVKASDSGTTSELNNSTSHKNSVTYSEENEDDGGLEPPVLNHCDHDIHNSESTDSFQSEGFEASGNSTHESATEISEEHGCEEQSNISEKEFLIESNMDRKKYTIDVDNLMLSHLKITELEGHTDIVFSVAADEDYILSSSADTTVRVWSTDYKSTISTFSGHSDSVTSLLLLNPNQSKFLKKKMSLTKVSRIAITGSLDCHIKVWSVLEGKELASVYTYNGITCLGYIDSECLVVVGTEGGKLELWDMASSTVRRSERAHEDAVTDIKVKDNYIYSVSLDGTVKVWMYEDDDVYPLYARKRKEMASDKMELKPTQWKSVAVSDNVLFLGDSTNNIKVLNWKAGNLRLFKNQTEDKAICECVVVEKNMLFSTCYDSSSDTGRINVWKLPEMAYVCSLCSFSSYVKSLAVVEKDNKLYVVCGGHKLCIWEFDFSKPPSSESENYIHEMETLGLEIDEKSIDVKKEKETTSIPSENISTNRWCNIM